MAAITTTKRNPVNFSSSSCNFKLRKIIYAINIARKYFVRLIDFNCKRLTVFLFGGYSNVIKYMKMISSFDASSILTKLIFFRNPKVIYIFCNDNVIVIQSSLD